MKYFLLFALVFTLLFSSCAPATQQSQPTVTPATTPNPTATATPLPILTPTPVPIPENLLAQKQAMEQQGYVFGEGEITHKDATEKEWGVVKFNSDGSAIIRSLDNNYQGSDLTLTAEEAANITIESLNARHDQIFAIKDQNTGKISKIFLPNVDKSLDTEAGWVIPLDISSDPKNPTKIDSAAAVHTKHVLYSSLIEKGSEPWPNDFPVTKFVTWVSASDLRGDKFSIIMIEFWGFNSKGQRVDPQARNLGYIELDTPGGKILTTILETKINDKGEGKVWNVGYSGQILDSPYFYDNFLLRIPYMLLYQAFHDQINMGRGGLQGMTGTQYLYEHDDDNQPWTVFSDEISRISSLNDSDLKAKPIPAKRIDIIDTDILDPLEGDFIFPGF